MRHVEHRKCPGKVAFRACIVMSCVSFAVSFSVPHAARTTFRPLRMHAINEASFDRRSFLVAAGSSFLLAPSAAKAKVGWVQFPCTWDLSNTYHLMRAGENLMEADNIWSTNPLFLTNREAALSENGVEQVREACQLLREKGELPSVVRYSLAASAMDTADLIARELKVGRDRLQAEFVFMDPRAVGRWDMLPFESTQAAVWAMDVEEAGKDGKGGRPPPNEDGTPHETLADQAVRLRQVFSLLESQYSGDTIVMVFPDGTSPALLSALIAGIPLNRVHELEYKPGELRLDVTMPSTLAYLKERNLKEYNTIVAEGRTELKRLRSMKPEDVVTVKEQRQQEDRLEMEEYMRKVEEKRRAKEEADKLARETRAKQLEEERQQRREQRQADGVDDESLTPVLLGAAAVGASAVAIASLGGSSNGEVEVALSPDDMPPTTNVTESAPMDVSVEILEGPEIDIPEMRQFVAGSDEDNEQLLAAPVQRINGDRQATFPPRPKPQDPVKAAEEAMQEYMDSDDGGSEWLQMMSDIMLEEDDDSVDTETQRP